MLPVSIQPSGHSGPAAAAVPAVTPVTLTPAESASLQYMREEEKLAHDVYVTLYAKWGLRIFNNISGAEQRQTDAIVTLLNRYGISDPAAGNPSASSPIPICRRSTTS